MTPALPEETSAAAAQALLQGRFSGRVAFTELIRQAFAVVAAQGWREMIVSDPDFSDWPLGERVVADSLND